MYCKLCKLYAAATQLLSNVNRFFDKNFMHNAKFITIIQEMRDFSIIMHILHIFSIIRYFAVQQKILYWRRDISESSLVVINRRAQAGIRGLGRRFVIKCKKALRLVLLYSFKKAVRITRWIIPETIFNTQIKKKKRGESIRLHFFFFKENRKIVKERC